MGSCNHGRTFLLRINKHILSIFHVQIFSAINALSRSDFIAALSIIPSQLAIKYHFYEQHRTAFFLLSLLIFTVN